MKILFVDTYYQAFLNSFYVKHDTGNLSYSKNKALLLEQLFGTADSYSYYFKKLGHNAEDLIINDEILQRKWAGENGLKLSGPNILSKLQSLPYINRFIGSPSWIQEIALAQIQQYKPDIVYMQNLSVFNPMALKEIKKHCKLLVGQIASPAPDEKHLKCFDLIITSFPHFVSKFKKLGINSEYQKLAFDTRALKIVGKQKRIYDVTFVGSFSPYHSGGTKVLEEIARQTPVNIWGQGVEFLSPLSPLRKNYHGEAWGLDMYKVLAQSKIVLNRHISTANGFANNMRLYESTGMGAMLLTDKKKNLNDIFKVGMEVVDYSDPFDSVKKIKYFLTHEAERSKIADAGQKRTLRDHNYQVRMKELVAILTKYLY